MKEKSAKNIFIAFILNLTFSILELVGGILTNSISIISDSIHDFGDSISIFITFLLEKKSNRKPDNNYTFGYLRYSTLGALFTAVILLIGSIIMIIASVTRIINPVNVNYNGMFILAVIGVIVNFISIRVTSHSDNINEKVINLHMLEDLLGWLCVLVGSLIIKITKIHIIDSILSLVVALFILFNVFKKIINIFEILLEKKPIRINTKQIKKQLLKLKFVNDIHHIHIWTIDGITNYITLHVLINEDLLCKDLENIKLEINNILINHGINHSTIEFETKKCNKIECEYNYNDSNIHHHH